MDITDAIESIKAIKHASSYDEITTKQTIILHVFQALGWDIFNRKEVIPEYAVERRRVDYSLQIQGKNMVFVEVKKPSEDLEKHEEQLLDYSFRQGIKLAILTNGISWWFYLPTLGEKWTKRKFYAINIYEQDIDIISSRFIELLEKENVASGKALENAEKIHANKRKKETIKKTLPNAWNKLIEEPDPLLIDLVAETTEKICGFRPSQRELTYFLSKISENITIPSYKKADKQKAAIKKKTQASTVSNKKTFSTEYDGRGGGLITATINGTRIEESSVATFYKDVLIYIVDNDYVSKIQLPTETGPKRYFLYKGKEPRHKNGKPFRNCVSYKDYHLEAHVNRGQGITYISNLCKAMGLSFELDQI